MTQYKGFSVTRSRLTGQWIATPTVESRHTERLRAATRAELKQQIDAVSDRQPDPWQLPRTGNQTAA